MDCITIILINVLYVSEITTNLISIGRSDLKEINSYLDYQNLRILKTKRKVGSSRIVYDLYAIMTDLYKVE